MVRLSQLANVLVSLAALVGCVVAPPQSAEEQVRERAQERWDALVAGNVEAAYALLSPGARQARSFPAYRAMIKTGFWKRAVVDRVECPSSETCKVMVVVEYLYRGTLVSTPIFEDWVLSDQKWWAAAG